MFISFHFPKTWLARSARGLPWPNGYNTWFPTTVRRFKSEKRREFLPGSGLLSPNNVTNVEREVKTHSFFLSPIRHQIIKLV